MHPNIRRLVMLWLALISGLVLTPLSTTMAQENPPQANRTSLRH